MKFQVIALCFLSSALFCPLNKSWVRVVWRGGSQVQTLLMAAVEQGEDAGVDDFLKDPYTTQELKDARECAEQKLNYCYDESSKTKLRLIIAKILQKEATITKV